MAREIEAKILLQAGEMDTVRQRLIEVGATPGSIDDEENIVFHLKTGNDRRRLRLRMFDGRSDAVLTCKRPAAKVGAFKSRDEFELHVSDAESARELLTQLGFRPKVDYRKRREHWYTGGTVVALDRLAFGDYVEVEGDPTDIEATLTLLGLSSRRHVDTGYPTLARRSALERSSPS